MAEHLDTIAQKDMTDTPETDKARAEYLETIWTSGARITKDLVPIEHARRMERERDEARRELETLRDAVRHASEKFDAVSWGWDGDCGSRLIIEVLEEHLPDTEQ